MPAPAPTITAKGSTPPAIDPTPRLSDIAAFKKAQDGAKADIAGSLDSFLGETSTPAPSKAPPAPGGRAISPKDRAKLPPPDPVRHDGPHYKEPPGGKEETHEEEVERAAAEDASDDSPGDDNRSNGLSEDVKNDLDSFLDKEEGKEAPKAKKEGPEPANTDDIDKEAEQEQAKLATPKALREAHKAQLRARREAEGKLKSIEAKLADMEAKHKELEASAPLRANEEWEKQRAAYEEKLRIADYTSSEEFQKQFYQPLQDSLATAYGEVVGVPVNLPDGSQRAATQDDFNGLLRMSTFEATKAAQETFGVYANEVLARRREVLGASKKMEEAKKNAGEMSKKAMEAQQINAAKQRDGAMKLYRQEREKRASKYAAFFQAKEGDDEGNELLKKGFSLVDEIVNGMPNASDAERLEKISDMHLRAAGFTRLARDNKSLRSKLSELEEKLKGYEASEPRAGSDRGREAGEPTGEEDSLEARLDAHLAKFPA
jgi:hypothetical protein